MTQGQRRPHVSEQLNNDDDDNYYDSSCSNSNNNNNNNNINNSINSSSNSSSLFSSLSSTLRPVTEGGDEGVGSGRGTGSGTRGRARCVRRQTSRGPALLSHFQLRTTRTLLLVSVTFLVLNLPSHVLRLRQLLYVSGGGGAPTLQEALVQEVSAVQSLI